ncbi:C6 transcription factor [Colletotrichum karsti]|uniref:C6 transcription factor n=1 Tax=Colletotrichum karsti TaxID=1095194 RepID=A0A9P6IH22_9PEZI|nr:C6 transcription factor [Colletotrichum karsti]KAF9882472.1 C6 transcription factor [Colletotrichum karsti]
MTPAPAFALRRASTLVALLVSHPPGPASGLLSSGLIRPAPTHLSVLSSSTLASRSTATPKERLWPPRMQHNGGHALSSRSPPAANTKSLQTQAQSQSQSLNDLDSDDGGQLNSADENDLDQDDQDVTRLGKRKRPISVSRNGALCEYKERKKPGLRAGYGRELEQRLDKLEEILRSHAEILHATLASNQHNGAAPSIRNSNPSLPSDHGTPRETANLFRPSESIRTPQAETALFLQKPSTYPPTTQSMEFGMPPPTPSMHEFQGQMPMTSMPAPSHVTAMSHPSSAAQEYYGTNQTHLHSPDVPMAQSQTTTTPDQDLPPYDLLYALVDLYFKHINTWCPILHRKTTLDSLFGPSTLEETDRILLHAIVATTLRYSSDSRLTEESRQHYHSISKQRVLLYGMENSSVKSLQALVILALDLVGSSNGPPGWNIMALITRSVVQLGLAVESTSFSVSPNFTSIYTLRAMILPEPKDFIEEESRRRLFWMIYLLDRYATLATAFEFALDDKEIDRTLPCRDDLWIKNQKVETRWFRTQDHPEDTNPEYDINKPENLGAFSYYIEILAILSKIHKFLKQPVDISALSDVEQWQMRYKELDNMLTSWKFGLPGEYGNMAKLFQPGNKTLNCGWVMLHATYHTAVIRLHSSAAYPTTRSPIFTPSYSASQRCHGAVENIAALGEFVVNNGLLAKLGPPFAFTLWVASRLLLVHGSTVEHKLSPQIQFFVETLREMGRYWPVAARYCGLLQRVLDEHRDSERQGDGVTPSSVKILADMRRTAFDLDFLISRQPRANGMPNHSRLPSVTPARTPAPNELEYLDVFDFFNVPRLPVGNENIAGIQHAVGANNGPNGASAGVDGGSENGGSNAPAPTGNEFNITNFMVDANSDWLFKQEGAKFLS